jgi:hypothetical protein
MMVNGNCVRLILLAGNSASMAVFVIDTETIKPESLIFSQGNVNIGIAGIPGETKFGNVSVNSAGQVTAVTNEGTISNPTNGWAAFWQNVIVTISEKGTQQITTLRQLTSNGFTC